jgi:hypothetical protein
VKAGDIAFIIALIVALVGGIWVHNSAPCGLWKYSRVGDMPARCINK